MVTKRPERCWWGFEPIQAGKFRPWGAADWRTTRTSEGKRVVGPPETIEMWDVDGGWVSHGDMRPQWWPHAGGIVLAMNLCWSCLLVTQLLDRGEDVEDGGKWEWLWVMLAASSVGWDRGVGDWWVGARPCSDWVIHCERRDGRELTTLRLFSYGK